MNSPNILFVMCDQLSAFATEPYGNTEVLTPNMTRLARRGTVFSQAYCNSPLCVPSRTSMMTGRLPSGVGVHDNGEEFPSSIPTIVHQLRRAGYKTVLSGKMHFVGADQLHGFEERLTTDIYPADYLWAQYWPDLGVPPRDPEAEMFGRYMAHMVRDAGPINASTQLEYDEEVHFRAMERLRRFGRRQGADAEQPWFLCVSYTQPHDPYTPAKEYWDRYEGIEIELPRQPGDDDYQHPWDVWANSYHGIDLVRPTAEEMIRARRGYYAMTSYVDDKLGELLAELDRFGWAENTVVVLTADHGDMAGEHGMFFKRTFREWAVRVPLIIADPRHAGGTSVAGPVSLVDLYPTLIDIAGLEMPDLPFVSQLAGRSLAHAIEGRNPVIERPTIVEYSGEGTIKPTRTVVKGHYKYVYVHDHPEMLFDLESDPGEWVNLAGEADRKPVLDELREICLGDWDPLMMEQQILANQRMRIFVDEALRKGIYTSWDYSPISDGSRMYVRRSDVTRGVDLSSVNQWDPLAGAN